ncbi:MAG: hypothetical protein A2559_05550 [Deltaproteobacteria bacterium RIFOXYD2_FULL_66_9]|nr:MAG: hypothetical protein A2559_05550 [Deltaproteobacteria bacterium RIFOXYD2_FULL_66_9]
MTPRASWGTRNGSIPIAPMENVSPSVKGRTGQGAGDRERTFFEKTSRFFRWRWIGISNRAQHPTAEPFTWSPWRWETSSASTSSHTRSASKSAATRPRWDGNPASTRRTVPACSTSVRFPELPLRSGVT